MILSNHQVFFCIKETKLVYTKVVLSFYWIEYLIISLIHKKRKGGLLCKRLVKKKLKKMLSII